MKFRLVCLMLVLSLSGCEYLDKLNNNSEIIAKQEFEIQTLQDVVYEMKRDVDVLQSKQKDLEIAKMFNEFKYIAFLTPDDSGYSPIMFDAGVLAVSLEDVKPYANGSKIKLKFGNTLATTINGLKARFEWGDFDSNGTVINDPSNSKDVSITEILKPGSWTYVSVVLDKIQPDKLGYVRIKNLTHDGISLR